jgi:hypothetical protein
LIRIAILAGLCLAFISTGARAETEWVFVPGLTSEALGLRQARGHVPLPIGRPQQRIGVTSYWRLGGETYRCMDYFFYNLGPYGGWCERAEERAPAWERSLRETRPRARRR